MYEIVIPSLYFLGGIGAYAAVHHVSVGLHRPFDRTHLLLAGMCLLVAPFTFFYTQVLQATDIVEFIWALKWNLACAFLILLLFTWFIAMYTGQHSRTLLMGLTASFTALIVVNLMQPYSVQYDQFDGMRISLAPVGL